MAKNKVLVEFQIVQKGKNFAILQKEQEKHNKSLDQADKKTKNLSKSQDQNYNRQKQGVIQTANSTKNFSKLSQTVGGDGGGPGGLVRAYALLAANVFALTAAFGVLSRSAQIDTLNQSMEVLSTTGGTYIKNLAKEMQAASGFAIDLAQSFRQVSLAASAGLNTSEIEGLTKVAKGAAISLGRNLPDAMDRIFRGAIKLEPEILDEIGLFVRVDEAAQKYARNNGKVVSALTQVEKRQAFLNEILEQGTKKFAEYAEEIKPDSYVRLGAALGDIAQEGLSLLNTTLGPLLNMLAESKTLLAVVFGSLVALLLKKAIPAMGLMTKTAAESANQAAQNARDYTDSLSTQLTTEVAEHDKALKKKLKNAKKADKEMFKQTGPQSKAGGAAELKNQLKGNQTLNRLKQKQKEINAQILNKNTSAANKKLLEKDAANLKKIIAAKQKIKNLDDQILANQQRGSTTLAANSAAARQQANLEMRASASGGIAQAVGISETQGMGQGFKELRTQINKTEVRMDKFGNMTKQSFGMGTKAMMGMQGTVGILTGGVNKLMAIMAPWMMLFGVLAAAAGFLASKLGINDKRAKAFADTLKKSEDLIETISKRFDSQAKAMQNVALSYREINKAALAYNKSQLDLGNSIQSIKEDFDTWTRSASNAAIALDNFQKQSFAQVNQRFGVLGLIGRYLLGDDKNTRKVEQILAVTKKGIEGMLKADDTAGLQLFEEMGVAIGDVRAEQEDYLESITKVNKMEEIVRKGKHDTIAADRIFLNLMLDKKKNGKKLSQDEEDRIHTISETNAALTNQYIARVQLFESTEDLNKAVEKLNITESQALEGSEEYTELVKKRISAQNALESSLTGAAEAIGKFNQAFMPKTKVDDIISSFNQINGALKELDAVGENGREKFFADFASADNPFASLISGQMTAVVDGDGKVIGRKLREEIREEFVGDWTDGQIFEALFKEAEFNANKYRMTIILAKVQQAELTKNAKRFNSISAGGLTVNIKEQTALLGLKQKTQEVAENETDILLLNGGLNRTRLKALQEELALNPEKRAEILLDYGKTEIDMLQIKGALIAENTATMEAEIKEATHLHEAEQTRLKMLQKTQQAQKQVTQAKLEEFKLDKQISNLETKGTSKLSAADQAKATIESAAKKLEMFLIEAKMKKALLDVEEKIVLARLRILSLSDDTLKAEFDMIAKQLTGATKAGKSALDIQMKNAAKTFNIELASAATAGFQSSITDGLRAVRLANTKNRQEVLAERRKEFIKEQTEKLGNHLPASGTLEDFQKDQGEQFDKMDDKDPLKQVDDVITSQQKLRESLLSSVELFNSLGPEGVFVGTVLAGTVAISDSIIEMGKEFKNAGDGFEGSMQKASAAAQFASEAIGAVGSIMAANSAQQVAAIDKQIAAEQKRDGKSAASIARIKALEGKKEAMQRKAFNQNKKMMMAQAVANTAAAITQTFADKGYPEGVPFAAVMAGIGALQLALIARTSYQGGGSDIEEPKATALNIGKRNNTVDVSGSKSSGELAYIRGEKGTGTTANNFRTGGATGIRGYAAGQEVMVGEQGPERIDIIPNEDVGKSKGTTNINFNISAVDGESVQRMLNDQQGNIISMIQSAANETGEEFLPQVDPSVYGTGG